MTNNWKPTHTGNVDGEVLYDGNGGYWTWHIDPNAPKKFKVDAAHIPLYNQPLATGLTAEEMQAMLLWLLKDPRCTKLYIESLPLPGDWHYQPPPELVQEPVNDQIP